MYTIMAIIFVIGYILIALEHKLHIDKSAPALLTGVICWVLLVLDGQDILSDKILHGNHDLSFINHYINENLYEHLSEISGILFFLLGAMTIVELIDSYGGFNIITSHIKTTKKIHLIWILSILTFFLSAALDKIGRAHV